jgi:TolA-binding protein
MPLNAKGESNGAFHFVDLANRYGIPLQAPEEVLFDMCYTPLRSKKYLEAIEFFKVLLERYPDSVREHFFWENPTDL